MLGVCYRAFVPESSGEEDRGTLVQGVSEFESLEPAFAGEEGLGGATEPRPDDTSACSSLRPSTAPVPPCAGHMPARSRGVRQSGVEPGELGPLAAAPIAERHCPQAPDLLAHCVHVVDVTGNELPTLVPDEPLHLAVHLVTLGVILFGP